MSDWLTTINPDWLLPLIGLIALLESLAIVGLLLPGVALLAGLCWLAGAEGVSVPLLLLSGFIGAVLGDWISFRLGHYALPWLQQRAPLRHHPDWLDKGERFFRHYGGSSVLLGRFIGPLRPIIPLVAGSLQMPSQRFLAFNLLSALLWAPAYLLPAYWLGQESGTLAYHWNIWTQLAAAAMLLLVLLHAIHPRLDKAHRPWRHFPSPHSHNAQLLGFICLALFLALLAFRAYYQVPQWELQLSNRLQAVPPGVSQWMAAITLAGDLQLLLAMSGVVCLGLLLGGHRLLVLLFAAAILLAASLNIALKYAYALPRPEPIGLIYSSYSFPSGHASGAAAFWGMLAVIFSYGRPPRWRRISYSLCLLPLLLIPLSRLVLGVHWPLDALAGLLEGVCIAALFRWLWQQQQCAALTKKWGLLALAPILLWLGYLVLNFDAALQFYQLSAAG
ncbi:phosphatase PAP2 family protein [Marinobacterium jannaschii]|uniref:phosphatase PAP2 family protein n=1 Tax=Marinobacterium jannaschii TaxID=64970 RepID=UPI00047F047B|nr:phosphatase PAP2 family protein [Marinobacterium jannaschii]